MPVSIRQEDLIQSIADALQYISYYHPVDYIRSLSAAYEREQSPAAKDSIAQILINSRMCAEGHRPICQDTGIVTVFLTIAWTCAETMRAWVSRTWCTKACVAHTTTPTTHCARACSPIPLASA